MNKLFLTLCFVFIASITVLANKRPGCFFGKWGFEFFDNIDDYQKYVGKKVKYIPLQVPEYKDKRFPGKFNFEYIITSITSSDDQIKISLKELTSTKQVDWVVHINPNAYSNYSYTFGNVYTSTISRYYSIPLLFYEDFEKSRNDFIGQKITNPLVKPHYECVDFRLTVQDKTEFLTHYMTFSLLEPTFFLKNSVSGKIIEVTARQDIDKVCFGNYLSGEYYAFLVKVDKPSDESIRFGESTTVVEEGISKYSYIDNVIDIIISVQSRQFHFKLKNISDNTIKVVWDEAVFVGFNGSTDKVMHAGIKYSEKANSQPPSIIIKNSSLTDIAVPISNVKYESSEWKIDSMFPYAPAKDPGQLQLMLPIQIKDVINEYIFTFDVKWKYNYPEELNL